MKFVPPIVEETEADLNLFVEANSRVTTASSATLNALGTEKPGYRLVEAVVDSGASRSAGPKRLFPGRLRDSAMSKKGQKFKGPDGSDIPNYGEMVVAFRTNEDFDMGVVIQISDVKYYHTSVHLRCRRSLLFTCGYCVMTLTTA